MKKMCCCPKCGQEAALICSGCKIVRYCSKEHQQIHWTEHRLTCKAFKPEWDVMTGWYLVANRALKPGDLIVQEEPLVVGFQIRDEVEELEMRLFCVGCTRSSVAVGGFKPCPQCSWPMCGDQSCWEEGSQHALGECALLKASSGNGSYHIDYAFYGIMVLRAISLRDREPKKWKTLLGLKDCNAAIKEKRRMEGVDVARIVKFVQRWVPKRSAVSLNTIKKLCRIFFVSSQQVQLTTSDTSRGYSGVYAVTSLIEHNCVANAAPSFLEDKSIIIRAMVPIQKGARISINHLNGVRAFWETAPRLDYLSKFKFIECRCQRCTDPTELGTFNCGMYCFDGCTDCTNQKEEKAGIMLPVDPLDYSSDWKCNNCSARWTMQGEIEDWLVEYYRGFENVAHGSSIADCEAFIRHYSTILHPNHSSLTRMQFALIDQLQKEIQCGNLKLVIDKMEPLVVHLLEMVKVFSPGLSPIRVKLLYLRYKIMGARFTELYQSNVDPLSSELTTLVQEMEIIREELLPMSMFQDGETREGEVCKKIHLVNYSSILEALRLKPSLKK